LPSLRYKRTLNEEETIQLIWRVLSHGKHRGAPRSFDPFSDDVSWFRNVKKKRFVVSKSEMLVAETDAPSQMSPRQIASKAITAAISDFAAKGVRPSFCIISIAIPKSKATFDFIRSMAKGFDHASRRYGVKILAGDTSGSNDGLVIDVAVFGFANSIVKRRGSKPGEVIGVSGKFGLQSSGLAILLGKAHYSDKSFRSKAKQSVLEPNARLALGLRIAKYLTSCIDSSDGLALSLYHIAESSNVDMNLDLLPTAEGVQNFANLNKLNENDLVLFGGEEYELVMTFKSKYVNLLRGLGVIPIGRTSKAKNLRGPAVYFRSRKIPRKGWIHNQ
jgi:thiamine-monophosphate kinase